MENKIEKTKKEKIASEYRKFKGFCKNLEKSKRNIAIKLCSKAAFMEVTLEELQTKINDEGAIIKTLNGNGFEVLMENPALKNYNTMIKNYNTVIKSIVDMIPGGAAANDALMNFVRKK